MSKVLQGKVALITGGSRGLGAVLAETLADQGADIAITYAASAAKAEAVVEKVRAKGVRAIAIQCDQADSAAAQPMVEQVVSEFGKLDILIGTMIEIPRAAVTAREIASVADFFSFGTNDLTQMTFGFSRDDVGKFLP